MFPEWMGNGWALTGFTCGFLIVSHLISYFLRSKKIRFWLRYGALFLGGAALLTSFHSASRAVSAAKMELASGRLDRATVEVLREVAATQNHMCNFRGVRTSLSPPNFDEIEQLRQTMCAMFTRIKSYADEDWDKRQAAFTPPDVGLSSVTDLVWKQRVEQLQRVSNEHREALGEVSDLQPQSWLFWTALEPFVISASWSLGLALLVPPKRRRHA
ncbi:hypothetical protein [Rhizobium rhizogenes]|uniref:hypothetical protein n=1 Tax=Rhizobium rhizogenes TaxID=359 RepID=UPI0022C6624A|nr:hypothetical protein [Rhizobium rhizogenes]MCZ7453334.1 hypothetical protein [Rhizobium rhizogenes]